MRKKLPKVLDLKKRVLGVIVNFYFGRDKNEKSKKFLKKGVYLFDVRRLGNLILGQKISPRNKSRGVISKDYSKK